MSQMIKLTARDLIRKAMTLSTLLGQGENPTDQEASDALFILNEIVDKWNIERLMITNSIDITFNLTDATKRFYTIGPTGDIVTARPPSGIDDAYYLLPTGNKEVSIPLQQITQTQYNSLSIKDLNVKIPNYVFFNATYPNATVYVYPLSNVGKVVLTVSDQFTGFQSLDDIIDLPIAYSKALRYTLAVELSLEYGRQVNEDIKQMAAGTKATIKGLNSAVKKEVMKTDSAITASGGFNIYSGD